MFSLAFIVSAFWISSPFVGIIGAFVFFGAMQEFQYVKWEDRLTKYTARDIMRPAFSRFYHSDIMQLPIEIFEKGLEKEFLVFDEKETVVGVLHQLFVQEAIDKNDANALIAQYASPAFEEIAPDESLKRIFEKTREKGYSILPVVENGVIVGVVDRRTFNDFLYTLRKK